MATPKSQRIGILIIAIVLVIGTFGSFLVMILSNKDQQQTANRYQEVSAAYQREQTAYQAKVDARDKELSKKYYTTFKQYASEPAKYDIKSVTSLKTKDLAVGTGKTIDDSTKFAVYYILWNPDGKTVESSIKDGKLTTPFAIDGLKDTAVIDGWKQGLIGIKLGGVRLLEIPSDLAYKDADKGDDIPPNTPLKFVAMAIPAPEDIPEPASLTKAYDEYQKVLLQMYGQ